MARNDTVKFPVTVMILLNFMAGFLQAQRCDLCPSKLPWPHDSTNQRYSEKSEFSGRSSGTDNYDNDFLLAVPNTYLERLLAERNHLKDEVALKDKEIDKLKATIQFVLQHLSKLQLGRPKEIPHVSTTHQQQAKPNASRPTSHPNKADDGTVHAIKRPCEESDSNQTQALNSKSKRGDAAIPQVSTMHQQQGTVPAKESDSDHPRPSKKPKPNGFPYNQFEDDDDDEQQVLILLMKPLSTDLGG